jgi:hypothetical protein
MTRWSKHEDIVAESIDAGTGVNLSEAALRTLHALRRIQIGQ